MSIEYNSQAQNGLLGVGFSLSGFLAITRCATTLDQDAFIDGVDFDSNDRFCLDGQRLVAVAGTYGANLTEYRTELDDFSKVVSYGTTGDPSYFTVSTKSGAVMEFGSSTDSRWEARWAAGGSGPAHTWALRKVTDQNGNYQTFSYFENATTGETYPTAIDYTGHTSGLAPFARVSFAYETRGDTRTSYVGGARMDSTVRLVRISTFANSNFSTAVRSYGLTYASSGATGRSQLLSIRECAATTSCTAATWLQFTPTTFQWQAFVGNDNNFNGGGSGTWSGPGTGSPNIYPEDFNGDGKTDLAYHVGGSTWKVCLSSGTTFGCGDWNGPGSGAPNVYAGDFNGDRRADLALHTGYTNWQICLSTGANFQCSTWTGTSSGAPNVYAVDFNGDGRTDLGVHLGGSGPSNWRVCVSTGANFSCSYWNGPGYGAPYLYAGDYNGDGQMDLGVHTGGTTWQICLSTGTNFSCSSRAGPGTGHPNIEAGDFNADGNTDLAYHQSGAAWQVCLSTGVAFQCSSQAGPGTGASNVYAADFNGDGATDLGYHTGGSNWSVCLRTALNFACGTWTGMSYGAPYVYAGDYNGDGKSDLAVHVGGTSWPVALAGGRMPDLLTKITNGLGAVTEIIHKPLTDGSVYSKYSDAVYPVADIQTPTYVVSEHKSSDGVGLAPATFQYSGAKAHLRGRGSLGFARQYAVDEATGTQVTTDYEQTFPLTGLPRSVRTATAAGKIMSDAVTTHASVLLGTGPSQRRFVYPQQVIQRVYEINGANPIVTSSVTQNEYNEPISAFFGNLSRTAVSVYAGSETSGSTPFLSETDNLYSYSTWPWGQLVQRAVTRTAPDGSTGTRTSEFEYDAVTGRLSAEEIEPGTPALALRTDYQRDTFGNITVTTVGGSDIETRSTTTEYDNRGQFPIRVTNELGHIEQRQHDLANGHVLSITGPNNKTTSWTYDAFGRKTLETLPDGTWTSYALNWCSGCAVGGSVFYATTIRSTGAQLVVHADLRGRDVASRTIAFDGTTVQQLTAYDGAGRISGKSTPHFLGQTAYWSTVAYDAAGRVVFETSPANQNSPIGKVTQFGYDGLTTTQTDALLHVTTRETNALGKVVKVTDHNNNATLYGYDAFNNLVRVTDANSNVTTMTYDLRGRKTGMTDPDMGTWSYQYNVLGLLVGQQDAKGQSMAMTYDKLRRPKTRTELEGTSTWNYDTLWKGALTSVSGPGGFSRSHTYDTFGRMSQTSTVADSQTFNIGFSYDVQSRLSQITYPTGFKTQNTYNAYGYLKEVTNPTTGALYWRASSADQFGNVTLFDLGNGANTLRNFDAATGAADAIVTTGPSGAIQSLNYDWDAVGNLTTRADQDQGGLIEQFFYDPLNRLEYSTLNGTESLRLTYNAIGNITSKSGVGSYAYGAKPHAVTGVTGIRAAAYAYDANGNMTSGGGRSVTWTSYNYPSGITKGTLGSSFYYDPDRARYKQISTTATTRTIYYIGGLYERHTVGAVTEHLHYIQAGGETIAIYTSRSSGINDTRYLHKDHLGSVDVVTGDLGVTVERFSYDAFGKRRFSADWTEDASDSLLALQHVVNRGFTFHEHIDHVALVHMNGRVYDPILGRFASADPFIQAPEFAQSLNRYSYVYNNPLSLTDPSGFFSVRKWIKKNAAHVVGTLTGGIGYLSLAGADHQIRNSRTWATIYGVAAAASPGGPLAAGAYSAYVTKRLGGSWKDAFRAAVESTAASLVGDTVGKSYGNVWSPERVAVASVAGGVSAEIQGGSFRDGLRTAFVLASLSYLNVKMREAMIEQSKLADGDVNINGVSEGLNGDGYKLAGARRILAEFGYLVCESLMGGCQGAPIGEDDERSSFFGLEYAPGDVADHINEAFAGPHDYLRNLTGAYDSLGYGINFSGVGKFFQDRALNYSLVFAAAPFGLAAMVTPAAYSMAGH